ncbi:hypothetical protein BROUX41_000770 [Berkeleyomyces rouxiae]|uniref:uncharacterized protein n=1 Tax=Berkeleyomyces rouxiae TaxID=2035830 RepID=UPI003B7FDBA9
MRFSLLATLASATLIQAECLNEVCSDNSFDLAKASNTNWMGKISSDISVSAISIPGTHASMTVTLGNHLDDQCQNTNLEQQLDGGIRYLDLKARRHGDRLHIFNGGRSTAYDLGDVFETSIKFLEQHETEFIIMCLTKDSWRDGSHVFETLVQDSYVNAETDLGKKIRKRLYIPKNPKDFSYPTLGEIRGKLLIIQDFTTETPGRFGIPFKSDKLVVSNWKTASKFVGMSAKWGTVESSIKKANDNSKNNLHITYTSVSRGIAPFRAAAGPKTEDKGLNDRLADYITAGNVARTGVVVMDFPGKKLVDMIIERNS